MSDRTKTSDIGDFWDERFGGEDYRYGKKANAFVAEHVAQIKAGGRVLCVGDGEGRNGTWLAAQGFEVTSVEPSAVGVAKIRRLAVERDVDIEIVQATLPDEYVPAEGAFDAVVLTYIHMPEPMRQAVHRQVVDALADGGVVLLEAFTPEQIGRGSGGPPSRELMYDADLLRADFVELDIELLDEREVELDEGHGHAGIGAVVRLLARK